MSDEAPKKPRKKATPKAKPPVQKTEEVKPVEVVAPVQVPKPAEPLELVDNPTPDEIAMDRAAEVLERRLGVGHFIASRLVNKLTIEECNQLVTAHATEDHESYGRIISALRFRKTPKPQGE